LPAIPKQNRFNNSSVAEGLRPAKFHEKSMGTLAARDAARGRTSGPQTPVPERLLNKSAKGKLSRRSTLMNADKAIVLNPRSSVFIVGQL